MATFQVDGDDAAENLALAQAAMNEADGITPEEPEAPATPEVPQEETEVVEDAPAEVNDLTLTKEEEPEPEAEEPAEGEMLDLTEFYAEYAENGNLSPESSTTIVDRLTKAGFADAEAILEQYMAGANATVSSTRAAAFEITGGEEGYAAMGAWASENLSAVELAAYDEAVANPAMVPLAVRGLYAQFQAATGEQSAAAPAPARVAAGANSSAGVALITSMEQLATLTGDPRMDVDPAYRAELNQRIAASMKAGYLK